MKRTVMAIIEVEDSVNNGQVLDTLENKFIIDKNICSLRDAIILDEGGEYKHERYLNYLMQWIVDHHDDKFAGCSPAGFDEWWLNDEDEEDVEYDVALDCNENDYVLASNGNIEIKKSLVYESFRKVGKELRIWFVDEDNPLHTYRVVEVTDDEVIAEFID